MKKIILSSVIKNDSDLLQFDARKIVRQALNMPENAVFQLPEGVEVGILMSAEVRNARESGVISTC
jgi:hypothetical protein